MATSQSTVDFLIEQIAAVGDVSARKMFGEYGVYGREMRLLFTVLPLLLAGACASSNLKGEKPVVSVGHITVGQAKVADPLSLDGSLRAFGAIGDPVIREYRRRGLRVLITYSKTANVGQLDGDVRHFEEKLVNGYSVRSAEYVYKFEQPNAPKFGRRAVVFFADFKREPSAPRLLIEAFCESEADCAIVSQLTASVFLHQYKLT